MLSNVLARFESRLSVAESSFDVLRNTYKSERGLGRYIHWHSAEGLLSFLWQSWSGFSRDVIVNSMLGCRTAGGLNVPAHADGTSLGRVAYLVRCSFQGANVQPNKTLVHSRQEVTWGDAAGLAQFVSLYRPSNYVPLLSGLLSPSLAHSHLRILRNSCAHLSSDQFSEVNALKIYYFGSSIRHPSDMAFWTRLSDQSFVLLGWIDELRVLGRAMVA